jgi:hypothetical protein
VNYARRQQYRRLSHTGKAGLGSVIAGLLGLAVASAGAAALGGLLLLAGVGLGLRARHWLSLANRSRVGADSEDEVQRALASLQAERPGPTTCATSPVSMSRRCGCRVVGEGGVATACWRSCASFEYGGCSASRTMSSSSRSIA